MADSPDPTSTGATSSSATSTGAVKVPVEERLFSLVLALLATETGLTKTEILSTVQGYRQRFSQTGATAALERQFERDKDDIRDLGVPLETVEAPEESGNNQNLRYRIPRGSYELPNDITFSTEETTLLGLAAMVWREGSLSTESRRALLKLRSLGGTTEVPALVYTATSRVRDSAFAPLNAALEKALIVRFAYLKPGESEARVRTVIPLALVQHRGRWHLSAEEPETSARKMFLLRRIVSQVTTRGRITRIPTAPSTGEESALALRELEDVWNAHIALVEATPDSDAAARLLKRRGTVTATSGALQLHYSDLNVVADELAAYGPEVLVISPPELRDAVRRRLERTAADHNTVAGNTAADNTENPSGAEGNRVDP